MLALEDIISLSKRGLKVCDPSHNLNFVPSIKWSPNQK